MSEMKTCLFCSQNANYLGTGPLDQVFKIICNNCGTYYVSDIIADQDKDTVKSYTPYKHLISGLIREKNDLGLKIETITTENILSLVNDSMIPRTIMQRLDKVLLFSSRKSRMFGSNISVDENTPYACGYATNHEEFLNMIKALIDHGFLSMQRHGGSFIEYNVTLRGLSRVEELLSSNTYSKKVFVAMGFSDDLLEAHKKAIQPACKECGFDALLTTDKEYNSDINDRIISEIKTSRFVITDFTYNNQGAYFEAGFAQGRGLEVIRTCNIDWLNSMDEKGEKNRLHFDINHYNFVFWKDHNDLKYKLVNRIKATIL